VAERALALDATGREWKGWWLEADDLTPPGHEAFVPDAPPDGDPDTLWYVPAARIRRLGAPEA
jgi:hypothetical protein